MRARPQTTRSSLTYCCYSAEQGPSVATNILSNRWCACTSLQLTTPPSSLRPPMWLPATRVRLPESLDEHHSLPLPRFLHLLPALGRCYAARARQGERVHAAHHASGWRRTVGLASREVHAIWKTLSASSANRSATSSPGRAPVGADAARGQVVDQVAYKTLQYVQLEGNDEPCEHGLSTPRAGPRALQRGHAHAVSNGRCGLVGVANRCR